MKRVGVAWRPSLASYLLHKLNKNLTYKQASQQASTTPIDWCHFTPSWAISPARIFYYYSVENNSFLLLSPLLSLFHEINKLVVAFLPVFVVVVVILCLEHLSIEKRLNNLSSPPCFNLDPVESSINPCCSNLSFSFLSFLSFVYSFILSLVYFFFRSRTTDRRPPRGFRFGRTKRLSVLGRRATRHKRVRDRKDLDGRERLRERERKRERELSISLRNQRPLISCKFCLCLCPFISSSRRLAGPF